MISSALPCRRAALAALALGLAALPARAIFINGEGPAEVTGIYDRFLVGSYPGTPVRNPSFIGAAFDLSGIGWVASNPTQSVTLISPQYLLVAAHYVPGAGSPLQFFGTDQMLHPATVDSAMALTYTGSSGAQVSDLALVRLTSALPATVTPLPIFYRGAVAWDDPSTFTPYVGLSLFNYGHTARLGTNELDELGEFHFGKDGPETNFGLAYTLGTEDGETLLEGGDSGSPTLAAADGFYGLIGTHSGVGGNTSVDAFVAYSSFLEQINTALAGDGQTVTLVPEPGSLVLVGAVLAFAATRRQRRD